jgi:heterodisulfide reductase subunit C
MTYKISAKTVKGELAAKVKELSGEDPNMCFQCGLCAGSCPMTGEMDIYTRKVMHMLQLGLAEEVLTRKMAFLCASCHACQVRCPRGIDIPKVVEALRLLTLRKNINFVEPAKIPAERIKEMPQAALVAGFRKFTA